MKSRNAILAVSITLGLLVWILDAVFDFFFFYEDNIANLLLFKIPNHELYIRVVIFCIFLIFGFFLGNVVEKLHHTNEKNKELIDELHTALADIKQLSGFLPICASCKKIRDDNGYWNQLESYIRDHSEAQFSHGICPECSKKLYPGHQEEGSQ